MSSVLVFLDGALMVGCLVIALKFAKYWRLSRDRFFIFFAAAFVAFGFGWVVRAFVSSEYGHLVYLPRLVGFLLISAGIFDKNRRAAIE